MSIIRDKRIAAGLTQQQMADLFEMPKRTIENWEYGSRKPAQWIEKLVIEKLEKIVEEKKMNEKSKQMK